MMTTITTATKSVRARTDAFLNQLSPQPIMSATIEKPVPAPKKLKFLTLEDYKQDIRARWLLLQREIYELGIDIKRLTNFVAPKVKNLFDTLKSLFSKKT